MHEGSDHLSRRYSTFNRMLRYKWINTHLFMDTFHLKAETLYAMKSKSEIPDVVRAFAKDIGVPVVLILNQKGT